MKVIIAGSRSFNDYKKLCEECNLALEGYRPEEIEVVSGTARGADSLGEKYAKERGLKIKRFPADWDNYGRSAGYRRNSAMAEYADTLIVFWDGESKGSKHMIDLARFNGLKIEIYHG